AATEGERTMTVVGKILVFFNLLFSLAVGGFAVANYAARTRYAKAVEEMESANRVVTESRNLYKAESDQRAAALQKMQESIANEAVADATSRQRDVEDMRRLLREETKTNTNLIKENNDLRDKMVQSTIDRQTAQDRASEMAKQVEDLGRQIERLKSSGGAGAG